MKWKGENILLHILLSGLPKYTRQRSCCFTHQQEQYTRWKIPVSLLNGVLIHKISSVMDKKLFYSEMFHRVWQCRDDKNQRALKVLSPTHEHSLAWNNYLMCLKGKKKKKKSNWYLAAITSGSASYSSLEESGLAAREWILPCPSRELLHHTWHYVFTKDLPRHFFKGKERKIPVTWSISSFLFSFSLNEFSHTGKKSLYFLLISKLNK